MLPTLKQFQLYRVRALSQRIVPVGIMILAILGSSLFIQLFAQINFKYDSFTFNLKTDIAKPGGTVIAIPPVGELFLKSHHTPWQLVLTLNEIDLQRLETQVDELPPKEEWPGIIRHELIQAVLKLFAMVIGCGLGGAAIILLAFRIRPGSLRFWQGMLASFICILLLIGTTVWTYDPHAIEHPQYHGVLASAPWMMNLVSMSIDNIEVIGSNLRKISQELPLLYKQAGEIQNLGQFETDLAVLHVSDIHNNPAAFEFISQLITDFKIGLVIDTGDLTDYGTPLEARILDQFRAIKVPYIFIPGNHDSPLIIEKLLRLRRVRVLQSGTLKLNGLTIAALADPSAKSYSSDVSATEELAKFAQQLTEQVTTLQQPPDIVAVHNRLLATELIGKVPLVLYGHDHRYNLTTESGTVTDDAGTTGAAGIRGLEKQNIPYSATILYWKKDSQGTLGLRAADSIRINGGEGFLTIDRQTF